MFNSDDEKSGALSALLKGGVIVIVLILLIPLLTFIGVPHIVFGYKNAGYEDIIDITDRAGAVDRMYRQIDDYTQEYIDAIIASYSDENDYDEVEVNQNISNTSIYWIIAINSVVEKQDLYKMTEDSVGELFIKKLTHAISSDSSEATSTNDEGEEVTVTVKTLKIDVRDLNPDELMDKLGFTDEERSWAQLLYESLESDNPLGGGGGHGGGSYFPGEALSDERFAAMIKEGEKYLGYPYVYGGSSPSTSFDCSGFVCWVINKSGVGSVGRTTAQGLYNLCTPISKEDAMPGDLIFFHNTYAHYEHITHVGIYVGNETMIHAGDPIGYASIDTPYRLQTFCDMGRLM